MANYQLTNKAVEDLTSIWLYTREVWSEQQADNYYNDLVTACENICQTTCNTDREYSEFAILFGVIGVIVQFVRWFLLAASIILVIVLTIGTFKEHGYGFVDIYTDYKALIYEVGHREEITKNTRPFLIRKTILPGKEETSQNQRIVAAVDYNNPIVKRFANNCTINTRFDSYIEQEYDSEFKTIIQALAICEEINSHWNYVHDPESEEYFAKASETIGNVKDGKYSGDCDDHAIMMCACIKAIGGKTRLVRSQCTSNGKTTGHLYPILYLGDKLKASKVDYILKDLYRNDVHFLWEEKDGEKVYWLNFDYSENHAGGDFLGEITEFIDL